MLGAASLTRLSPLAAPWRGWDLFLVAHWKPSIMASCEPKLWPMACARAEEEEGAGWGCDPAPWPAWPWAAPQHVAHFVAPESRGDTKHLLGSLVLMFSGS